MLTKVNKAPSKREINELKREYKKMSKQYSDAKYQFNDSIRRSDFEVLSADDFLNLKELYIQTKKLYWKIYQLEHPDDIATVEAYRFLNHLGEKGSLDFLASHGLTTHRLIDAIRENPNYLNEVEV